MLDILKPPTDNLYKFMALSGLLMFLVCLALAVYIDIKSRDLKYDASVNLELTILELESKKQQLEKHKNIIDMLIPKLEEQKALLEKSVNLLTNATSAGMNTKEFEETETEIRANVGELNQEIQREKDAGEAVRANVLELDKKRIERQAQVDKQLELEKSYKWYANILIGGAVSGLITAALGFILWHIKLQRYEDLILKQKVEEYIKPQPQVKGISIPPIASDDQSSTEVEESDTTPLAATTKHKQGNQAE